MDESKKLNKSKYINKRRNAKYSQKKRAGEAATASLPPREELSKNWGRYDEEEPTGEMQCEPSRDYSVIANRPIAQGTSFHFKKDKYFLPGDGEQRTQSMADMFKVDLYLLSLGLETVPFHERIGIDGKYFKDEELSSMRSDAEKARIQYDLALKEKLEGKQGQKKLEDAQVLKKLQDLLISDEKKTSADDSLSSSLESLNEVETVEVNKDALVQDLEDWLEDILN